MDYYINKLVKSLNYYLGEPQQSQPQSKKYKNYNTVYIFDSHQNEYEYVGSILIEKNIRDECEGRGDWIFYKNCTNTKPVYLTDLLESI